ncbi:MCE family protein [Rhodococcus erythropolis]|uniref:MCE family protein n=1 Tax=Rhodococcus erythropolis TaxID=1833 RepID=UPI00379E23FF
MRSRLVQIQLVVFGVVAVLAVGHAVFSYMGLQRYTGIGMYSVSVEMERAGGLYVNSLVTYRGVDVGVVTDLEFQPDHAVATLQIRSGPDIPTDTDAIVKSVSAIGEQYIDLVPTTSAGPYLADGDVIAASRTSIPIPSSMVVDQVHTLLEELPKDDLRTTVDEAYSAFNGLGPSIETLVDSAQPLIALAQAQIAPTQQLITDAEPVLGAVNESGPSIATFSTDLASFSEQLALNDDQIRTMLDRGPEFFDTVSGTLADLESPLPVLLANLQTVGEVTTVNVPGIRQLLVVYPALSASINYMHQGFQGDDMVYGQGPLDVKLGNTANPLPCTEGYDAQRRDPSDLSPMEPSFNPYCRLPQDDARAVRGARNVPCASDPTIRTAEVENCPGGLPSGWPQMLSRPGAPYVPATNSGTSAPTQQNPGDLGTGAIVAPASYSAPPATVTAVPYDPTTGRFRSPDGTLYELGSVSGGNKDQEVPTWQALFV